MTVADSLLRILYKIRKLLFGNEPPRRKEAPPFREIDTQGVQVIIISVIRRTLGSASPAEIIPSSTFENLGLDFARQLDKINMVSVMADEIEPAFQLEHGFFNAGEIALQISRKSRVQDLITLFQRLYTKKMSSR